MKRLLFIVLVLAFLPVFLVSNQTFAAGEGNHDHKKLANIGSPGNESKVKRIVNISMFDHYFKPQSLQFKEGETVRFIVRNSGEFVHEFSIATKEMHKSHGPEMLMMVDYGVLGAEKIDWDAAELMQKKLGHGMHNEPNSVLLEPGKTGEIVWTFSTHAVLEFACNVPGHYESGMVGKIKLTH